jgi:hypothetical protein
MACPDTSKLNRTDLRRMTYLQNVIKESESAMEMLLHACLSKSSQHFVFTLRSQLILEPQLRQLSSLLEAALIAVLLC